MSGGRLILPAADPVLTNTGVLNVGATLTVYNTGTNTLATIYADVGLTTPITNPQTSNTAGRFYAQSTEICADISAAYDCVLALTDGESFTYPAVYALGAAPTISGYAPINSPTFTGTPAAPTAAANNASSQIATTQFVATAVAAVDVFPTGMYGDFAMTAVPTGWLVCDGSAVSRASYAALFGAIGTTYGVGNGTTTFNLPNFQGYFPRALNPTGSPNSSGPDYGRALGSTAQLDAFQGHYHLSLGGNGFWDRNVTSSGVRNTNSGTDTQIDNTTGASTTDTTNGTPRIAAETRPVNVAVVRCIHV